MAEALCDQLFSDIDGDLMRQHTSDTDDLLGILESWEDCVSGGVATTPCGAEVPQTTAADGAAKRRRQGCRDVDAVPAAPKRQKCSPVSSAASEDGAVNKTSHITVERNRRKQMNEHIAVLRSLMPCFYVKRVTTLTATSCTRVPTVYILGRDYNALRVRRETRHPSLEGWWTTSRSCSRCCSRWRPRSSARPTPSRCSAHGHRRAAARALRSAHARTCCHSSPRRLLARGPPCRSARGRRRHPAARTNPAGYRHRARRPTRPRR